jgi:hypothetical protein
MPYLSWDILHMRDHSTGWQNESRGEEILGILVLQDRVGEVVGMGVLDCMEQ